MKITNDRTLKKRERGVKIRHKCYYRIKQRKLTHFIQSYNGQPQKC